MLKVGLVGNVQNGKNLERLIEKSDKFRLEDKFETSNDDHLLSYTDHRFDDFIKPVDVVMFTGDVPGYTQFIEKSIYKLKHVFTDGLLISDKIRMREWSQLVFEAGVVFHAGNQLSVSPAFLSVWPYLKDVRWFDLKVQAPFQNKFEFVQMLNQSLELVVKTITGSVTNLRTNGSNIFTSDYPDHLFVWIEGSNGVVGRIDLKYSRDVKEIAGSFATKSRLYELDFINQHVWEHRKNENNSLLNELFNHTNDVTLHSNLPEITKVTRQVIYFDSMEKELINFWDNITNQLTPLTGINELVEVSELYDQVFGKQYEWSV
jgi:hypothetical protein